MRVVDAARGQFLHTIAVGPHPLGMVVDEQRQRVFVGYRDGLDALDGATGSILHTFAVGPRPDPAAVDERGGHVFVSIAQPADTTQTLRTNGQIVIVDPRSGAIERTDVAGVASAVAVDGAAGRALILDPGGQTASSDPWGWVPAWLRRAMPFLPGSARHSKTAPATVTIVNTSRT